MSLATRCPVCQTVFRVVQDQLKVSEGWVRCGRCAKVFNAFEGLFDLEREFPALRQPTPAQRVLEDLATRNRQPKAPSSWGDDLGGVPGTAEAQAARAAAASPTPAARTPPPAAPMAPTPPLPELPTTPAIAVTHAAPKELSTAPPRPVQTAAAIGSDDKASRSSPVSRPGALVGAERLPPGAPSPAPAAPSAPVATRAAAAPTQDIAIRDEPAPVAGAAEVDAAVSEESFEELFRSDGELAQPDTAADLDINLDAAVEPAALDDAVDSRLLTFVQQADRAERWRRPGVRVAIAALALALTALLAAQVLIAQRDAVVAQWPGTRPWVQALCTPLDCRIEPLRRIDSLGVESSGLTRIDDGPVYRLVLVLHNRSDTALLMPAIDLSLTDTGGVLVTRRVLSAADLGTPRTTIGAGQELPLQALLMSADRALAGYTIEIFYP